MRKVFGWVVRVLGMAWTLVQAAFVLVILAPAIVPAIWLAKRDMRKRGKK